MQFGAFATREAPSTAAATRRAHLVATGQQRALRHRPRRVRPSWRETGEVLRSARSNRSAASSTSPRAGRLRPRFDHLVRPIARWPAATGDRGRSFSATARGPSGDLRRRRQGAPSKAWSTHRARIGSCAPTSSTPIRTATRASPAATANRRERARRRREGSRSESETDQPAE